MKTRLVVFLLLPMIWLIGALPIALLYGQDVSDDWQGTLRIGTTSRRMVFHIMRGFDGLYFGQIDSLDQNSGFPIDSMQVNGDSVRIEAKTVQGIFQGTLNADKTSIAGTWTQGTTSALELTRVKPDVSTASPALTPADLAQRLQATGVPMDVRTPVSPTPFIGSDRNIHLAYELHMTNIAPVELHIGRIDVLNSGATLETLEGIPLIGAIHPFGVTPPDSRIIGPGQRVVAYLWVTLKPGSAIPQSLRSRIIVDGFPVESISAVSAVKPIVLGPPLRGSDWVAGNGPSNESIHRRALMPINGSLHDAQRFAIDWVKVDSGGRTFSGDEKNNRSYYAYGKEALAAADGIVTEIKDGIPENVPGPDRAVPITLETVGGNHVILDLGGGRFAFYAHFQPGSLRVKVRDRVRRGQVLGLVGNSGNSSEPHLHFHISDSNSALGSEGIPYLLDSFDLFNGNAKQTITNALPLEDVRVSFP